MDVLKFIGKTSIRTSNGDKDINLHPGEQYNKKDLSNDYLKSLIAQGLFEEVTETPKEEEVAQPTATVAAANDKPKTPKSK